MSFINLVKLAIVLGVGGFVAYAAYAEGIKCDCIPAHVVTPPLPSCAECDDGATQYFDNGFPGVCAGEVIEGTCFADGHTRILIGRWWCKTLEDGTCEMQGPFDLEEIPVAQCRVL